jgi:hypothetical protein
LGWLARGWRVAGASFFTSFFFHVLPRAFGNKFEFKQI